MLVAAALAAYPPLVAGRSTVAVAAPAAFAFGCAVVAVLLRSEAFALLAVLVLGGAYAGALFLRGHALDARAPLYAVLLALLPELVAWSAQARRRLAADAAVRRRRVGVLAGILAASVAAGALVVGVSVVDVAGGLLWLAGGVVAVVAALAVLAAAATSR